MIHVFIFTQILALFLCVGVIFDVQRIGKSSNDPFAAPILAYAIFSALGVLMNLLTNYLIANIENIKSNFPAMVWAMGGYVLACGSALALLVFLFRLKKMKTSLWAAAAVTSILFASGLLHFTGIADYLINAAFVHICPYRGILLSPVIVVMAALVWFLVSAGAPLASKGGRGLIFRLLVGYAIFALFCISTWNSELWNSVIRLGLIGVVYSWYRAYRGHSEPGALPDIDATAEALGQKYGLSKREKEVLALLLAGKSNKGIETSLFLSSSTVRNHISSIYEKIGINSRGQLTGLVFKFRKP
jgi:DNA-binding CsgD family transcriptional regulator